MSLTEHCPQPQATTCPELWPFPEGFGAFCICCLLVPSGPACAWSWIYHFYLRMNCSPLTEPIPSWATAWSLMFHPPFLLRPGSMQVAAFELYIVHILPIMITNDFLNVIKWFKKLDSYYLRDKVFTNSSQRIEGPQGPGSCQLSILITLAPCRHTLYIPAIST